MLRVAIVGCGKIADAHASQIARIQGCEIVGVCDREILMASQLAERYAIKQYFEDLSALLAHTKPDVVHITTPPESHFDLARFCLERGRHVYIEKPVTLNAEDTGLLVALATERGLRLTAGHDQQFGHAARRMRALVQSGYLGGAPVHVEGYSCYDLGDREYARAFLGDRRHWVRRLPGQLLQNTISHGIAGIAEFLTSEAPQVVARGFVSPMLRATGETDIVDELRVIICEEGRTTAYFTFSSQMRPLLHQIRVYGPKRGLVLDHDQDTLIKLRGQRFKSYAENFIPPVIFAGQHVGTLATNLRIFLARDFHVRSGMKYLIEAFYRSIMEDTPVPIPYGDILRTARIMDAIFGQLAAGQSQARHPSRP